MAGPTPRWTDLRAHQIQQAYWNSLHRFNVLPCGRRSGKTELAKRKTVKRALLPPGAPGGSKFPDPHYFCAAPTRDQAKRIYWDDLKALVPRALIREKSETELTLWLWNGASISVLGMDKPERIEGSPWDGGILDEYGNMKGHAWGANVRPALADRRGWCDLIGVPEGRNHYYDQAEYAKAEYLRLGAESDWRLFTWKSADILDPSEIAEARRNLDPLTFEQEYEASFVNFQGKAYYQFGDANRASLRRAYNPKAPLILCFDFNVDPGVCAVAQEMLLVNNLMGTGVIGEVHIPLNSNTPAVCRKIIQDWGEHQGMVYVYGDASGGARGTAKVDGSDWDIIKRMLKEVFKERLIMRVPSANPPERSRINAMNTRIKTHGGEIRLMVDPTYAPHVVKDLDGVKLLEGGSGEIDKKADPKLTHISDALGYYIVYEFPINENKGARRIKLTGI